MFNEIVKRCVLIGALAAAGGWSLLPDEARVLMGRHEFLIPKGYIINSPLPLWLKSVADLPSGPPWVSLLIPAEEVAARIDGFQEFNGQLADDLFVGVELLDEDGLRTYSDPEMYVFSDPWYGRGIHKGAKVGLHPSGLYQVGIGWSVWKVMKIRPDPSLPPPDDPYSWFIGSCRESSTRLTRTDPAYSCTTMFLHEDLRINVSLDEINLPVVEEVRAFVVERLESWSVDDRGTAH